MRSRSRLVLLTAAFLWAPFDGGAAVSQSGAASGVAAAGAVAGAGEVAFPPEVHAQRRARLFEAAGGVPVIVPGADRIRSGGVGKQDLDFWYLTGVESPWSVFVMVPDGRGGRREVLFLPDSFQFAGAQYSVPDPRLRRASWNRTIRRLAPGPGARAATGIAETELVDALVPRLRELIGDAPEIALVRAGAQRYAPPGLGPLPTVRRQLEDALAGLFPSARIVDAAPLVHRLRLIKDEHEIERLREAARISAEGMIEAMRATRPGMNDLEIAGLMEYVWKREGAQRASFSPIVASGESAVSLYTLRSEAYDTPNRVMRDGELLFVDYGAAEYAMYTSDLCRTWPVSGRFTPEQRRVYEIALEAQDSAFARIRPGAMMVEVIQAAAEVYRRHGLDALEDIDALGPERIWGLMPSPGYWVTGDAELTDYSGARGTGIRDLGHHIGLDALDSRDYSVPLQPGMVFTVEPKLYMPDLGAAIMIEDMILVTEDGYENLSALAPRTVEDIERIMAGG